MLGEILVRKGRIRRENLASALTDARAAGERLGTYLVRTRVLYEQDISVALADQFGLRYVVVDPRELDPSLAPVLPERVARKYGVLPIARVDERVRFAVADPTDVLLTDELRIVVEGPFELVVADPSSIRAGLDAVYTAPRTMIEGYSDSEDGDIVVSQSSSQSRIHDLDDLESAPAVEEVNRLLRKAIQLKASDIHFLPRRADLLVRARVDGVMRDVAVVPDRFRGAVIARLKVMGQLDIAERRLPQDGRVSISVAGVDMDLRVAILPCATGEEAVLRIAYIGQSGLASFDDLGLAPDTQASLLKALRTPAGAVIVAGPTGSGKTTTLYSALNSLNDGTRTIVSIEDPVESLVDGVVQIEVNARAGLTFARGLRTILRADPDVILVGEIRDLETAEIALHAAMTGHVVLTTVHAQTASAAIVRLRELGLAEASVGSSVHTVVAQRLLRRPCVHCAKEPLAPGEGRRIGVDDSLGLFRPSGCQMCDYTGYTGRIAACELLTLDDDVRAVLSANASTIQSAASKNGYMSLYDQARRLCQSGRTTVDEVVRVLGESD